MDLQERSRQLDARSAEHAEQIALMKARAQQMIELQQRVEADRQSIRQREQALTQAEETRKALQEQLLRRNEELAARAKAIEEQAQGLGGKEADLARARLQTEQERRAAHDQFEQLKADLETCAEEIHRLNAALTQREENVRRQVDRLKETGLNIATDARPCSKRSASGRPSKAISPSNSPRRGPILRRSGPKPSAKPVILAVLCPNSNSEARA